MQRKLNVVEDLKGNKIVVIHDVKFKGKRSELIEIATGKEYRENTKVKHSKDA